jgi:cation:H+ antiporter
MDLLTGVLFVVGIGLLILGAELLVRGASGLALSVGLSPLVVGLTVVALGTSSPELAVAVQAALSGAGGIALGNVIGSNIANVLLILGAVAVITPLTVNPQIIRQEVPIAVAAAALVLVFALDGALSRLDGALLVAGMIGYTAYAIVQSRREEAAGPAEPAGERGAGRAPRSWLRNGLALAAGLVLLTLGSQWLVNGAVAAAQLLGVDDLVIGLTVVAIGTSLPEIASSLTATLRGERDIAVGNIVGSCICNLLAVLGLMALVSPVGVPVPPAVVRFDLPVMLATIVACLPIMRHGGTIYRWEGALFLGYYVAYTLYLLLASTQHVLLRPFSLVMLAFVIPLTLIGLSVVAVRDRRDARRRQARA